MPTFFYKAIDVNGKKSKGIVEARQMKQARELLREKNLIVLNLRRTIKKNYVVQETELAMISRQLATLLLGGVSIEKGLQILTEQTEKGQLKQVLLMVHSKLLEGMSLSAALRETHFPKLYYLTIVAGEKTGRLEQMLVRLTDYLDCQCQIRKNLQQAFIYPGLMMFISFAVVIFLLQYVVPKMIDVYSSMNQTLPCLTRWLIYFSNHLQFIILLTLICCIVPTYAIFYGIKKSNSLKEKIHRLFIAIPFIGTTVIKANIARFLRTVTLLSQSGVPVLEAMKSSLELIFLLPLQQGVNEAIRQISEGASIHLALKQSGYFSAMCLHLIASGEASGQLDTMMDHSAKMIEAEIKQFHETVFTLLEPAVTLFMGAIVLVIALAMLLPVFQLDVAIQ